MAEAMAETEQPKLDDENRSPIAALTEVGVPAGRTSLPRVDAKLEIARGKMSKAMISQSLQNPKLLQNHSESISSNPGAFSVGHAEHVLLEESRADSSSIQSLAAGVNYYAPTTKASQAASAAQHKQLAWDWLSSPQDKQPLKETQSIRYQCECTSKAAYQMIEVLNGILDELKGHKETMAEQCKLLKMIASNQVELSKILKGSPATGGKGQPPSGGVPAAATAPVGSEGLPTGTPGSPGLPHSWTGGCGTPMTPAPFMPFAPPPHAGNLTGPFWCYQPSVATNYEPNESKNPLQPPTPTRRHQTARCNRCKCWTRIATP